MLSLWRKAFTLLEIMIVIAIIWILISALTPAYINYLKRSRDTARVVDIDQLIKMHTVYYSDNEFYPLDDNGCVNEVALAKYLSNGPIRDPITTNDNGCLPLWRYGYAMTTLMPSIGPSLSSLLAHMEMPNSGNYTGGIVWFTGILSSSAYNTWMTFLKPGAGQYYIKLP